MKLVIVESPTKAKTLSKYLDKEYKIAASMGHIRDLPKSGLGVDVEKDFEPIYEVPIKAKKVLAELKKIAKDCDEILLATDPDREGEAISWHLKFLLEDKKNKIPFKRVVFHELTEKALKEAFSHFGDIDLHLVDAQQARRILDRLVGYKLSPLLWKKVRYGLSAGRVQSVAVRLVVERERERDAFKPDEYWECEGLFLNDEKKTINASLEKKDDKKIELKTGKQADLIKKSLLEKGVDFKVSSVKNSSRKRNAFPPLKTSTLQQSAANVFGMSASKTMSAAQKLFEKGLITYHRTDSLNLSPDFVNDVRAYIASKFGKEYLPESGVFYKTNAKNAQEAHEAIRPTNLSIEINTISAPDEKKIYSLILKRALECQMNPSTYDVSSIEILSSNGYLFKTTGSVISFDGWLAVGKKLGLAEDLETIEIPEIKEGESLTIKECNMSQHFTQPPARYSDATLIKKLEELGIGRPSTYAPTLYTIYSRGYVEKEARYYKPTDVAYVVIDLLVENFPEIVGYEFTAQMEEKFDDIAEAKTDWVPVIKEFYVPFEKIVKEKDKNLSKHDITNLGSTGEKCPECGKDLVFKLGKFGKFVSCSDYPDCSYAKPTEEDSVDANEDFGICDKCNKGKMILKKGRFGKFLACEDYPKCKNTKPYLEKIGVKCPKCKDGDVVEKKAKGRVFYGCSKYPECDYSSWKKPIEGEKYIPKSEKPVKKTAKAKKVE